MEFNFDLKMVRDVLVLIIMVGIPLAMTLWGIWTSKKSVEEKIKASIPVIWGVVQQELRKNGGKLPGGKTPLEFGLELLGKLVKLNSKQKTMATLALRAYHEAQGAPDAVKKGA